MNLKDIARPRPKQTFTKKSSSLQKLTEPAVERAFRSEEISNVPDEDVRSSSFAAYNAYGGEECTSIFVDDNPLAALRMEKVAFVPFSGELGEKLKMLCSGEGDDETSLKELTGARLRLKLIEKHNMNKPIDLDSLDADDAAWYKDYMESQQVSSTCSVILIIHTLLPLVLNYLA